MHPPHLHPRHFVYEDTTTALKDAGLEDRATTVNKVKTQILMLLPHSRASNKQKRDACSRQQRPRNHHRLQQAADTVMLPSSCCSPILDGHLAFIRHHGAGGKTPGHPDSSSSGRTPSTVVGDRILRTRVQQLPPPRAPICLLRFGHHLGESLPWRIFLLKGYIIVPEPGKKGPERGSAVVTVD